MFNVVSESYCFKNIQQVLPELILYQYSIQSVCMCFWVHDGIQKYRFARKYCLQTLEFSQKTGLKKRYLKTFGFAWTFRESSKLPLYWKSLSPYKLSYAKQIFPIWINPHEWVLLSIPFIMQFSDRSEIYSYCLVISSVYQFFPRAAYSGKIIDLWINDNNNWELATKRGTSTNIYIYICIYTCVCVLRFGYHHCFANGKMKFTRSNLWKGCTIFRETQQEWRHVT